MPKHAATRQPKTLDRSHDKRQPINSASSPRWIKNYREQINATLLISRLQRFATDNPDQPTGPRMTRTQAQVALSLLRKVLPVMQAIEITGAEGAPIQVQVLRFSDVDAPSIVIDAEPAQPEAKPLAQLLQIEDNPRLVEDEPPEVSPRMTTRRKRNQ